MPHPNSVLRLVAGVVVVTLLCISGNFSFGQAAAKSKKGLQVENVQDALALGIDHAAINVNLCQLVDVQRTLARQTEADKAGPELSISHTGQLYWYRESALKHLDLQVQPLSAAGVRVNVILLCYLTGNDAIDQRMIHPKCVSSSPNNLGAFNTVTGRGRDWFTATIKFLARRWSGDSAKAHGKVTGWIVGNEVNSHWWWSNMGHVTMAQFINDYEPAVRMCFDAVKQYQPTARVYVSLEHHWNIRYSPASETQAFPASEFLSSFAKRAKLNGDFPWHVAFHPYPENLFDAKFWEDDSAPNAIDAARVTFRNLGVLMAKLDQPDMIWAGVPRRVVLSEQGFHSGDDPESERIQAAAYCLAYKIVDSIDGIDAFILHRHVDHPQEGGLNLGLRRREDVPSADIEQRYPRKPIYDCFHAAGTPDQAAAFQFALPLVGMSSWADIKKYCTLPAKPQR